MCGEDQPRQQKRGREATGTKRKERDPEERKDCNAAKEVPRQWKEGEIRQFREEFQFRGNNNLNAGS